jgi:hypothetical protein
MLIKSGPALNAHGLLVNLYTKFKFKFKAY